MKKYFHEAKYRQRSVREQKKILRKGIRKNKKHSYSSASNTTQNKNRSLPLNKHFTIKVPDIFSMTENPVEMVDFLIRLKIAFRNKPGVFIDLSETKQITADAVTVLVSYLKDGRITLRKPYVGNNPKDMRLKQQFAESGFYKYVRSNELSYSLETGNILARHQYKVDGEIAKKLISFGTEKLFGQYTKQGGTYNVLTELMNNTRDHATGRRKHELKEKWWASAHYDNEKEKVTFTFLDNGVGIFNSRDRTARDYVFQLLKLETNIDLLKMMLSRQLPSSTKFPYRGRGIPSINANLKRQQIKNLVIISNDVFANVDTDNFFILKKSLNGTFFSWEIHK